MTHSITGIMVSVGEGGANKRLGVSIIQVLSASPHKEAGTSLHLGIVVIFDPETDKAIRFLHDKG